MLSMLRRYRLFVLIALALVTVVVKLVLLVSQENPTGRGATYPTGRGATYLVAATDAPAHVKAQADYVADGIDDQVEIQAAMDALPYNEYRYKTGKIQLSRGTFTISSSLLIPRGIIWLDGEGSGTVTTPAGDTTALILADNTDADMIRASDTTAAGRVLYLSNLSLMGNKENQSSGNGINLDYIDLGGHYQNGLLNVSIKFFKENGIKATTDSSLSAGAFTITNNGGDGINSTSTQGWSIAQPNWVHDNGGWGVNLAGGTDNKLDLYIEANGKGGGYLNKVDNSHLTIWTKSNNWQGLQIEDSRSNTIIIQASLNGQSVSGAGSYAAELVFGPSGNTHDNVVIINNDDHEQQTVGIDHINSLYFVGQATQNRIVGSLRGTGYSIYVQGNSNLADTVIQAGLYGDDGVSNIDAVQLRGTGLIFLGSVGQYAQSFSTEGQVEIGVNGSFGVPTRLVSSSGLIGLMKVRTDITNVGGETITVKYELVYRDGTTADIEKTYAQSGATWLVDDDLWNLMDSKKNIAAGISYLNVYAKTSQGSTSATLSIRMIVSG